MAKQLQSVHAIFLHSSWGLTLSCLGLVNKWRWTAGHVKITHKVWTQTHPYQCSNRWTTTQAHQSASPVLRSKPGDLPLMVLRPNLPNLVELLCRRYTTSMMLTRVSCPSHFQSPSTHAPALTWSHWHLDSSQCTPSCHRAQVLVLHGLCFSLQSLGPSLYVCHSLSMIGCLEILMFCQSSRPPWHTFNTYTSHKPRDIFSR